MNYVQRWFCAAPVGDGTCGQRITGWQRDPIEVPSNGMFRQLVAGPVLTHLPCGHDWWIGGGWAPQVERVPWAEWVTAQL
jgi:hypothetical protein